MGRTVFDYVLNLTMTNRSDSDVTNVVAELLAVPENVEIITDQVSVGDLAAGATVATEDTFTIRVDRSLTIDPLWISWRVEYTRGGRSEEGVFGTWIDLENLGSAGPQDQMGPTLLPKAQTVPLLVGGQP